MSDFYQDGFPRMHRVLPDGACEGQVEIRHRTPTPEESALSSLRRRGYVRAGETLCQLFRGRTLWMSDTQDERRDHIYAALAVRKYGGHILVGGLGLGMFPLYAALQSNVNKVTVVEIDPDVIKLVEPHLRAAIEKHGQDPNKLNVIEADLMTWRPPKNQKYDVIWFDIWVDICTDNLPQMASLNRRFGRRTRHWRGCWKEHMLKAQRRRENSWY